MKGDFTRFTFDAERHYASVRMQQGRVLVDADWNEEHDILAHRIETESVDVIGKCGAPLHAPGFHVVASASELTPEEQALPGNADPPAGPLLISAGRYYVDGLLIENEHIVPITEQPDLPPPGTAPLVQLGSGAVVPFPPPAGTYIVYVDVWQRHITALEDDSLREKALGGPDTATRTRTIWQVKLLQADAGISCTTPSSAWDALIAPPSGTLEARSVEPPPPDNPCSISPGGGYRRLENQLYRVEVHDSGNLSTATFKWSRDNGSVVTRWLGNGATADQLKVTSVGPDEVLRFAPRQWVELTDDEHDLQGKPGILVQLANAENDILTILPATAIPSGAINFAAFKTNPKVRRWEADTSGQALRKIEIAAGNDGFLQLEDGVEIKFSSGSYRSGDYWLIPARTATADVEWPKGKALPPRGVQHHYCRIGIAEAGDSIKVSDCRPIFPPLTELPAGGGDLKNHNKYLHGWGVVCGLQVHCGGQDRQTVRVEKGYAIACDGTDIWIDAPQTVSIVESAVAAKLLDDKGNGTACITLKPAANGGFAPGVSADPESGVGFWQHVLEGTLIKDIYDDCLKPLLKVLGKLAAADAANAKLPVSDAHRNQIAAFNLLVQLANQSRGSRVFLSTDEHKRLVQLYKALADQLSSKTFCGIREALQELPGYPFADSGIDTAYGKGALNTVRVHPALGQAYAFGGTTPLVQAFNLRNGELEHETVLPGTGITLLDVLPLDQSLVVAAADANQTLLFTLDAASLQPRGSPVAIAGARVMRLIAIPNDAERGYALVQGVGLVELNIARPAPFDPQKAVVPFNATGHLSSPVPGQHGVLDYVAGAAAQGAAPERYSTLVRIRIEKGVASSPGTTPIRDGSGQAMTGADAVELMVTNQGGETLQVVVDAQGEEKALLAFQSNKPSRLIPLGAAGTVSLAAVAELGVTAMALENEFFLTWVNPDSDHLDEADRVPLQVAPTSFAIARAAAGAPQMAIALNRASRTLTTIPIDYLAGKRRFDMAALAAYRAQMLAAWRDLLLRLAERVKDCICEHLLLDCPVCSEQDVVILACVEIRGRQVYSICNFHRREVITFRKLFYWLSAIPIIPFIRELVEELCCLILPDALRAAGGGDLVPPKSLDAAARRLGALDPAALQKNVASYFRMIGNVGLRSLFAQLDKSNLMAAKVTTDAVLNQSATAVKRSLASAGVEVNTVVPVSAAATRIDVATLRSAPLGLAPGDKVDLYTDNGKVVFYALAGKAPAVAAGMPAAKPADLRPEIDALRAELADLRVQFAQLREKKGPTRAPRKPPGT